MQTKQSRSLVKTASLIHRIVSQVLFCVEQNRLDIITVYEIIMTFVLTINLSSFHWVQHFLFSTNLHAFLYRKLIWSLKGFN